MVFLFLFAQMVHEFHGFNILFEDVGKGLRFQFDGAAHKLGDVVALHELAMIVGVFGGQLEGFGALHVLVDVGDEGACIDSIGAARGEDDPSAVARPGVVALGVVAVDAFYGSRREGGLGGLRGGVQVDCPEVGIAMPNVEAAPSAEGEEQPTSIGRDAGQGGTFVDGCGVEHQLAWSELALVDIEGFAIDVVFDFLGAGDGLGGVDGVGAVFEVGAAIVEPLAVGRPEGEHLELFLVVLDVHHLVALDIVDDEVALGVEHLNLVKVARVEGLLGLVGGVGNELEPRVPAGIDACGEDGVVAHVHLMGLPFVDDDGSTVALTGVELHLLWVVHLVVVAVDALSVDLVAAEHVVVDDALVVVLEAALVDGELLVGHVGGRDESVADVGVDGVGRDEYLEGFVARPCPIVLCEHLHLHAFSFCLRGQRLPIVDVGLGLDAAQHDFLVAERIAGDGCIGLAAQLDGERCDVHGDGDANVVGIDVGRLLAVGELRGDTGSLAGGEEEDAN